MGNATSQDRSNEIVKVRLERQPCFGSCPVFVAEVEHTGTLRYEGAYFVPVVGARVVQLPRGSFARLAEVVERSGFWALRSSYAPDRSPTDLPARLITVETTRRSKTVRDYGLEGPVELARIERAIIGRIRRHVWGGRAAHEFNALAT